MPSDVAMASTVSDGIYGHYSSALVPNKANRPARLRHHPLLLRSRDRQVGKFLFQAWIDIAGKAADAGHGFVVLEKPSLPHDQQVSEAADVVVKLLDLPIDLVGRAGEHDAGFDRLVDRRVAAIGRVLIKRRATDEIDLGGGRQIAGWVLQVRWDLVGGHIPEELFRARARLLLGVARVQEARIGQPIDMDGLAAAGFSPAV